MSATTASVPSGVFGLRRALRARYRWPELTTAQRLAVGEAFLDRLRQTKGTDKANADAVVGFFDEVQLRKPGRWHDVVPPAWQTSLLREAAWAGLSFPDYQPEPVGHLAWGAPLAGLGALVVAMSLLYSSPPDLVIPALSGAFVFGVCALEVGLVGAMLHPPFRKAEGE